MIQFNLNITIFMHGASIFSSEMEMTSLTSPSISQIQHLVEFLKSSLSFSVIIC